MLLLTRYKGESIIINENIEIIVLDIGNQKVKIGINAPDNIPINREEIHNKILKEREENKLEEINNGR